MMDEEQSKQQEHWRALAEQLGLAPEHQPDAEPHRDVPPTRTNQTSSAKATPAGGEAAQLGEQAPAAGAVGGDADRLRAQTPDGSSQQATDDGPRFAVYSEERTSIDDRVKTQDRSDGRRRHGRRQSGGRGIAADAPAREGSDES